MFYSVSQEQFIEGLNVKIAQNVVRGLSAWRKILCDSSDICPSHAYYRSKVDFELVWPKSDLILGSSSISRSFFVVIFSSLLLTEFCRSTLGQFDGGLNMAFPWQPNLQGTAEWYCNLFFFLSQSPPRTVSSTHSPSHPLHTPQRATFTVSSPQSAFPVSPPSPLIRASPLFPHCHLHHLQNPLQLRSQ